MWYVANIFSVGRCPSRSPEDELWCEDIVLIQADSSEQAEVIARDSGKSQEVEYESATGDAISWSFVTVGQVVEVGDELKSGEEIFSRHLRASEAQSLLSPLDP
jgi:hypothetical protein